MVDVPNVIIISDIHGGCQFGLCPPKVTLDSGGTYSQSPIQTQIWEWWNVFWNRWVPKVTRGEPYSVVNNGDALDGVHHNSNHQITHNLADQENIAYECLAPIVNKCEKYYHLRGTSAHSGESGQYEEQLAKRLGAVQNEVGNYTSFELWLSILDRCLCHTTHHIGTTGTTSYQTTGPMKELTELFLSSSLWGDTPPDIVVRSHRHIPIEVRLHTHKSYGYCFVTPGWQAKTPFVYKLPGGRYAPPMFGGSLIRVGDEDFFTRHFVKSLPRSRTESA